MRNKGREVLFPVPKRDNDAKALSCWGVARDLICDFVGHLVARGVSNLRLPRRQGAEHASKVVVALRPS